MPSGLKIGDRVFLPVARVSSTTGTHAALQRYKVVASKPEGRSIQVDLGNGLIWEGPALSPEEWSERMKGLPPAAGFGGGTESLVAPDIASPTPEASTLLMMGVGIAAGLWWRRRA